VISNIIESLTRKTRQKPHGELFTMFTKEITIDPHPTQVLSKVEGVVQALELILS